MKTPQEIARETDRELLELAAKAAGIEYGWQHIFEDYEGCTADKWDWNPLTDDGDALRMEVALKMTAAWESMRNGWSVGAIVDGEFRWLAFGEDRKRASVTAAAAIGEQMK